MEQPTLNSPKSPVTEAALQAARKKYKNFQAHHKHRFGAELSSKLLDFGCGAGGFLMASAMAGINAQGI